MRLRLETGDKIVLCSDGVWSVIQDNEFARLAGQLPDSQTLSHGLVDLALERQTDDNCSVVVVHIHGFQPAVEAEEIPSPGQMARVGPPLNWTRAVFIVS